MTIITKPRVEKGSIQKPLEKPLIINIKDNVGARDSSFSTHKSATEPNVEMWLSPSARRRISTSTTVCVFITALLVMSIGIIGGVYLYRQVTQHQTVSRFRGWCGIPYERNSLNFHYRDNTLRQNRPFLKEEWMSLNHLFKEEVNLDLASDSYADITVPDFGYGRKGVFIHDFKMNKTGIIDEGGKRCFVMPLDRQHVQPPKRLLELIQKMWRGYYSVDTKVVRKRMRVILPPIEDLNTQGAYISSFCSDYTTYLLEEKSPFDRLRRETDEIKESEEEFTIAEFAGRNIVEFTFQTPKN